MVQNFAFVYAIILDTRERPLFPKWLIPFNIIMPILFAFATGVHCHMSGPLAWDGVITFYIVGFTFLVQLVTDAVCLALSAREEYLSGDAVTLGNEIVHDYKEHEHGNKNGLTVPSV
jgi:hypothetical protein